MRKYIKALTAATSNKTVGNHRVVIGNDAVSILSDKTGKTETVHSTRRFLYHGNIICAVDDKQKRFWLSHAGWFTSSTTCALTGYNVYFSGLGYKECSL
jgi:hypothetical protein